VNQQEAAALLSVAAAFDNRKPDADAATAWAVALEGFRFIDCRDAVVAHYRTSSEWLMPQKVITEVKRIRAKRVADHGPVEPPADLDPDDTLAWRRWQRETTRAIADGNPPPRTRLQAVPMPKELAAGMERFGRIPTDQSDEGDSA
jgi:hypothetical protein